MSDEHSHGGRIDNYDEHAPIWSGEPNDTLVLEVARMQPSTVLDVGSGEGADAVWLARSGWTVVGIEPSLAALGHARKAAEAAGVDVTWIGCELLEADLPAEGFGLVSAFYPALMRTPKHENERAMLDAVAPGGELLAVHHVHFDREKALQHGFDPEAYVKIDDIAEAAGEAFEVVKRETRTRKISGGEGAMHTEDDVLRLRRIR